MGRLNATEITDLWNLGWLSRTKIFIGKSLHLAAILVTPLGSCFGQTKSDNLHDWE